MEEFSDRPKAELTVAFCGFLAGCMAGWFAGVATAAMYFLP